jgi:trigger factor
MGNTPVDIPESMLRVQLDSQWRNFARQINMPVEQLKENLLKSEGGLSSFEDLWRPEAVKALHSRLIVETLMKDLNLEASDEDIEKELVRSAQEENTPIEEIREFYEKNDAKDYLAENIKEQKLFDILLAESSIKIGDKKNYSEIIGNKQ